MNASLISKYNTLIATGKNVNPEVLVFYIFNLFLFIFRFRLLTDNQYMASSSLDKTVSVWDIPNGLCIRVIYGVTSQLCIRFHPVSVHLQLIPLTWLLLNIRLLSLGTLYHLSFHFWV